MSVQKFSYGNLLSLVFLALWFFSHGIISDAFFVSSMLASIISTLAGARGRKRTLLEQINLGVFTILIIGKLGLMIYRYMN